MNEHFRTSKGSSSSSFSSNKPRRGAARGPFRERNFQVPLNPRQVILDVLTSFDKNHSDPEHLIDTALKAKKIDHRDRRFIFEIVYGVIRYRMTLDHIINKYIIDDAIRNEEQVYRILRVGLYQLAWMDRVPDHAAVNETVKLAKNDAKSGRFSSVVNAVMRNFINENKVITLPDPQIDLTYRLSVEFSHPDFFVKRWMKNFGLAKTKQLLAYNNIKPAIFLRKKLRDFSRQQFEADVRTLCEPSCGFMNLYYKMKKSLLPENLRLIQYGLCTVQAPSSGWVVAMMDINKGEKLLDMCSAPGGKTSLMAELTDSEGAVCAGEVKFGRIRQVSDVKERMQLDNVYPVLTDGNYLPFNGYFDKVLLDAPCTGTGVFNHHPEARWVKNEQDIEKMTVIQEQLLKSAAQVLHSGGILVYSTCSLEPEENEIQIRKFLSENPSFELDAPPSVIPGTYIDNDGFLRITPFEHSMDGIFAARLKKL
ncbi:MAG TPA: 16S rRNA (cytosine(967)-C(5))-methyltransferase RsmB [Chitinispirillaceae bacterium]|nr:16S rRNA (cytosine(967)-C(5))-methyltransferase RsmB [Chitinispirillaceae bacterium]